nr:hypothetical protein [Tanacetum cinerariifolium]
SIDRGVAAALAECDADRSKNGDNSNDSGTGGRRKVTTQRECTYTDFLKCQPMSFQGTKRVVGLTRWVVGHDVAYAMPWAALKRMITDKYCPRGEIQKLESEYWNLKGHYKSDFPRLKNGNFAGNRNAMARAYAVRTAGINPNSNVVM